MFSTYLGREILNLDGVGVVQGERLDARKGKVLGCGENRS